MCLWQLSKLRHHHLHGLSTDNLPADGNRKHNKVEATQLNAARLAVCFISGAHVQNCLPSCCLTFAAAA